MRTTLDIDDTVLRAARALAAERGISIGKALSDLAARGLAQSAVTRSDAAFPILTPVDASHVITDELVLEHRDDE